MSSTHPNNRFRPLNPFVVPDLAKQLSDFLLIDDVLSIYFTFGSVRIMPEGFQSVSAALVGPLPAITVNVDAPGLVKRGSNAEYDATDNVFSFRSNYLMSTARGRGDAVHEASHAVADFRKRSTSVRSEEGAAYVAEAWYHLNIGSDPGSYIPEKVTDVAAAVRSRAVSTAGAVHMSSSEINTVRREMMNLGYGNKRDGHFYTSNNGF